MIKNTKRIFALVLAVAVVAMSMFTGFVVSAADRNAEGTIDLLEFGDYLTEAGSTSKYWDTNVADNGETGADWDNAIIIDSAEEFVYLCKASGDETKGKYYKVADGIAGFNLANKNFDINGTLADNLDVILSAGKNHAGGLPGFQGHFDGNGATVYGAWANHNQVSNYAGLFSCTKGEVTIKNIHVNKAHFTAKNSVGGIIGYHAADDMCTVTIENCSVTDSYLETQGTGYGHGVGAIIGYGASAPSKKEATDGVDYNGDGDTADTIYVNVAYNIKNCYVNLDEANFVSKGEDGVADSGERVCHGGVAGVLGSNALMVSDSVVIGIVPYATSESTSNDVQHTGLQTHFKNIYTTEDVAINNVVIGGSGDVVKPRSFLNLIFPLSDAQLKGAAAMENLKLDWSVWMADANGYPELRSMHQKVSYVDNGDGTHNEVCACGFGGLSAKHVWANNECACGAKLNCAGRDTIYWDGTTATGIAVGSGTKDDPYVISSASEFAWLIENGKADNTAGKYYKIADNIGTIVLQPEDLAAGILALETAEEVQAYFEDIYKVFKAWPNRGWEATSFAGVFDGNGATVYGLFQTSGNNAGLFSTLDAGAVIKNIGIKNSYITSTVDNYQVGALAANTNGVNSKVGEEGQNPYGLNTSGAIWFNNCIVANNYMYNNSTSHDRSGVIIGASSDIVYMDNCLVYGNNATYGANVAMPVWSSANNSVLVSANPITPEGLVLIDDGAAEPRYYNKIRNSVIMGATPYDAAQGVGSRFNDSKCFEHVYSDAAASAFFGNKLTDDQIKYITVADLATAELGDAWFNTTSYPDLKVFHDDNLVMTSNDNGSHSAICSCGAVFTALCSFVDGECSVCGAALTCASKRTIYWDGTIATGFADASAGTKEDPIIISSASELAYLVTSKADVSTHADGTQKYFEIAEDIGTIVLQSQDLAADIIALDSAADTQAFFEDYLKVFAEWPEKSWEQSCFAGSFDGNGVKIYGLYIEADSNAGLFSTVEAGASIRNVAVLNSYIVSHSPKDAYQVGAIAAVTSNNGHGLNVEGVVWFEGCIVGNCYMRNDAADLARSGVIFGAASSDSVAIDNCLVYGNDAYHGADHATKMTLINTAKNAVVVPGRVPAEFDAKIQENANANGDSMYYNTVRNTIAFGTDIMNTNAARGYRRNDPACYENNYTDGAAGTVAFSDGAEWTYEDAQIKAVTLATLNENDLGDAWVKTETYPELKAAHITAIVSNGDGTHSVSCPCGAVTGVAEDCSFTTDGVCSVCGAECVHVAGEAVEENRVEATCKAEGSYDLVVYCTVCGKELSRETVVIEKAAHTHGEAVEENRIESTCTVEGSYDLVVYCTVCDEEISREAQTLPLDPNNHTYENDDDTHCSGCGAERDPVLYGDVNGDGNVNNEDYALLMQFINQWPVTIDEEAADVFADGEINNKDYAILMQFINGWDVVLGAAQ